jgi:DNA-binding transcriptional regulator YiaG
MPGNHTRHESALTQCSHFHGIEPVSTASALADDLLELLLADEAMSAPDPIELTEVRAWLRSGVAREIREAHGLSLAEVARSIGVCEASLSRWECGSRVPHGPRAR